MLGVLILAIAYLTSRIDGLRADLAPFTGSRTARSLFAAS